MSIGHGEESFESENDWLNECDATFGTMCMAFSPSMRYLKRSIEYPKDLWKKLDITFGKNNEDHNSTLESTSNTISILDPKISTSTISDEVVQDEEAETSTQSIRIEDSLHAVTPSPDAPEVHEISDISYSHIAYPKGDI